MRFRLLLTALMATVLAAPVWARGSEGEDDKHRVRRATTILFADDPTLLAPEPFEVAPWLAQNLRFDQRGLKYIGRFGEKGEDRVVLRIRGPIMKKDRFGLMLDVRF
jgi:hypothetical protein